MDARSCDKTIVAGAGHGVGLFRKLGVVAWLLFAEPTGRVSRRTSGVLMSDGEICAFHYASGEPIRLRWRAGTITHVEPAPALPHSNVWVAPALFDPQVNGYGGIDFQQDGLQLDDLLKATRELRSAGCSRFLLTFITDEWTRLIERLRHVRALRSQSAELEATIAGWHIEGPFLSERPGFHGAHNPALMIDPTPSHVVELRAISGDDVLLLTIAPERPGSIAAIECAVSLGMKISLGHTDASAEILRRAVQAGAGGFTHLGNGCPRELDRHDNILWRVFETPGLKIGLIPDQIHVSPALFRLVHKTFSPEAIYHTTDAMSAAGAPPGRYRLGRTEVDVGADQVVREPGKSNFAGSALRPIDGVFRAAATLNLPWQKVWDYSSRSPATWIGLPCGLEPGNRADFCLLTTDGQNGFKELSVSAVT
jgi:N-acetylglucosamine-6-phosphate deacetylase